MENLGAGLPKDTSPGDGFVVFDRVQKSYDGEILVVKDLNVVAGEQATDVGELRLSRGGTLSGVVYGAASNGLVGMTVTLSGNPADPTTSVYHTSDSIGAHSIGPSVSAPVESNSTT